MTMRRLSEVNVICSIILLSLYNAASCQEEDEILDLETGCKIISSDVIRCYDVTLKDPDNFDRSIENLDDILLQVSQTDSQYVNLEIINCDVSYFPDTLLSNSNISGLYIYLSHFESFPEEFLMAKNLQITTLELYANEMDNFDALMYHQMSFIPTLQEFNVRFTDMTDISKFYLQSFTNIEKVDLSDNDIRVLPSNTFRGLHLLKLIDLKDNKLTKLRQETFSDLISLIYLDLSGNSLIILEMGTFVRLENLQYLGLENNLLMFFEETTLNDVDQPNLELVNLEGNMFVCDHRLAWLKRWLIDRRIMLLSKAYCYYPQRGEFGEVDFDFLKTFEQHLNNTIEEEEDVQSL